MDKDPVCGMQVDRRSATEKARYSGKEYVFCSASCRNRFESQPDKYVT